MIGPGRRNNLALLLSFLHLQKTEGQVQQKALLEKSGAAHAQLKALIDKGILVVEKRKIDRLAVDLSLGNTHLHQLSSAQQLAYDAILEQMKTHSVNLLHGITGSGKDPNLCCFDRTGHSVQSTGFVYAA